MIEHVADKNIQKMDRNSRAFKILSALNKQQQNKVENFKKLQVTRNNCNVKDDLPYDCSDSDVPPPKLNKL